MSTGGLLRDAKHCDRPFPAKSGSVLPKLDAWLSCVEGRGNID
jgi:hypothetical protein